MSIRYIFFAMMLFVVSSLSAQDKYISCHHTKNKISPAPLTDQQRVDMVRSIERSDTFDIAHYDIHLDVRDYSGSNLIANTIITYIPKMDGVSSINLDLQQLTIDSITTLGVLMDYTHVGTDLHIELLSPTVTGEASQISIWYHGTPYLDPQWGGFYFQSNYIYNLGIGISTIPPNFGKVWYPCFDTYVERATYDFYVISDDGWRAFCQGQLVEEVVIDDETVMRHFNLDKPIPTYLSAVAVAEYESYEYIHTGANGDIPVRLTSKAPHQVNMQNKFVGLGSSIDALEFWFGPEYWGQIGYVITVDGAMEHPTNIAYPQALLALNVSNNENIYTHELGHHWWGDMVSQSSFHHMWLKEGPAEYSVHLMREWNGGAQAYIEAVKDNHEQVLESAHIDDDGFQVLSPIPEAYIYGTHSYNKGASVMHSMRGYMGDELFRQGIQWVLDSTLNGVLDPEKFQTILTLNTGVELEDFFNDWVYKPGFSSFEIDQVTVNEAGGIYTNEVDVQQKLRECPSFYSNVPLEITAWDENYARHDFQFVAGGEFDSFEFETDFYPIFYALNANNKLNLAKLDYNQVIFEETNTITLPYTDFKLKVIDISDSANVYVEHQWISPDQDNLAENIDELSGTHYWIVNGDWDASTFLEARLNYHGANDFSLDFDLYDLTEAGAMLAYRASPGDMWIEYPYYTLFAGSLTNGNGSMKLDSLMRGEYAFAKGNPLVSINELNDISVSINVFPNPATDYFVMEMPFEKLLTVEIIDNLGKRVKRWNQINPNNHKFDVSGLSAGQYVLRFYNEIGEVVGLKKLVKESL